MKQTLFLTFCLICIYLLSIQYGCKKDVPKKAIADSLTLLTQKDWYKSTVDQNPSSNPKTPFFYQAFEPCLADNIIKFQSAYSCVVMQGQIKCEAGEPDSYSEGYSVNFSSGKIRLGGVDFTILDLSESQLKLSLPVSIEGKTMIQLFKHKD